MTAHDAPLRTDLLTAVIDSALRIERAQLTKIELAPAQRPGAHRHPCDVIGTILSGSIRFHIENDTRVTLHAGDPFHEPRDAHVLQFDNDSDTEPAVFLACYLLGPGQHDVITMDPTAT